MKKILLTLFFIFSCLLADSATLTPNNVPKVNTGGSTPKLEDSVIWDNGNVGVGTSDPQYALHVIGEINADQGLKLNGVDVCLSDNTNCYPVAPGGWTDAGATVYATSTGDNVGIGTINPLTKLHVKGELTIDGSTSGALFANNMRIDGDDTNELTFSQTAGTNNGTLLLNLEDSATDAIFSSTNKTGVNWTSLDFVTSGTVTANAFVGDGSGLTGLPAGGGWVDGGINIYASPTTDNVAIGTTTPTQKLTVVGTVSATAFTGDGSGLTGISAGGWTDNGTNVFTTATTDKVGIGTTTPFSDSILTVKGSTATGTDDFIGLFVQNGQTPDVFSLSGAAYKSISVQGDSGAFYMGRDITNDIEFVMGTSVLGVGFAGTTTTHPFQIRTSNSSRIQVGTDGNVGIGTSTPNARMTVFGTSTGAVPIQTWKDSGNTQRMAVLGNGTVGIGTAGPRSMLDVAGDVTVGNGTFTNTSANEDLYVEGNLEVDGTIYGDGSQLTGIAAGGWVDGGASITTTTTTDTVGIGTTTVADGILQIGGDNVVIGIGGTNNNATSAGELYVNGDLEVDGTIYGDGAGITGLSSGGWTDGGTNVYPATTSDQVAIGTTTPVSGAILTINGTIAGSGTGPMAITDANVGIGTTTAGSLLTIGSTGQVTVSSAGAIATSSTVSVADDAYAAGWNGSTAVPTKNAVYDKIETLGANAWTDAGAFVYATTSTDNVGIGTSSPNYRLQIRGSVAANLSANIVNSNAAGVASFIAENDTGKSAQLVCTGGSYAVPNLCGIIATTGDAFTIAEADGTQNVTISGTGNVGIGSTAPNGSLDIRNTTSSIGWSIQNSANQACNTTCTAGCVFGFNTGALGNLLSCADTTADSCLCAGSN